MKNNNFIKFIEKDIINIFKIILFNKNSIIKISKNNNFLYTGIIFLILNSLINSKFKINNSLNFLIVLIFIFYIFHLITKYLFEGKANFLKYFLVISNIFILYTLTILPFVLIQILIGIWVFILNIYIIEIIYKISRIKSTLIGIITIIFLYLLSVLISLI